MPVVIEALLIPFGQALKETSDRQKRETKARRGFGTHYDEDAEIVSEVIPKPNES